MSRLMQKKLDKIVQLINELVVEAKLEYGPEASVFFEADGCLCVMSGDCDGPSNKRQEFIELSASKYCRLGAGAW